MSPTLWLILIVVVAVVLDYAFVTWRQRRRKAAEQPPSLPTPVESAPATSTQAEGVDLAGAAEVPALIQTAGMEAPLPSEAVIVTPPEPPAARPPRPGPMTNLLGLPAILIAIALGTFAQIAIGSDVNFGVILYLGAAAVFVWAVRAYLPETRLVETEPAGQPMQFNLVTLLNNRRAAAVAAPVVTSGPTPTAAPTKAATPTAPVRKVARGPQPVTFWTHWRYYTLTHLIRGTKPDVPQPPEPEPEPEPIVAAQLEPPVSAPIIPPAPIAPATTMAATPALPMQAPVEIRPQSQTVAQPAATPAVQTGQSETMGGGAAPFLDPRAIATTPDGNLWVLDAGRRAIYRMDGNGTLLALWPIHEVPNQPGQMVITADSSAAYITDNETKKIFVYHLTPTAPIKLDIAPTLPAAPPAPVVPPAPPAPPQPPATPQPPAPPEPPAPKAVPAPEAGLAEEQAPAAIEAPKPGSVDLYEAPAAGAIQIQAGSTAAAVAAPPLPSMTETLTTLKAELSRAGQRLVLPALSKPLAIILISLTAALLIFGQYIIFSRVWWNANPDFLEGVSELSCLVPTMCTFDFPSLFGLTVLILLVAGLLGAWLTYQPVRLIDDEVTEPTNTGDNVLYLIGFGGLATAVAAWGTDRWWLAVALTVAAGLVLWQSYRRGWPEGSLLGGRVQRLGLLALGLFMLLGTAYGLRSWQWAAYGDDYSFYFSATNLLDGSARPIPWAIGVDGYYAVGHTLLQAIGMWVFGADGYGWRIGSAISLAITVPGVYLVARLFFSQRVSLLAAGFFAGSHLLMSYSKIGYNHAYAFIPMVWAPALIGWGLRRDKLWLLALGGAVGGLGFYTLALARLAILPALWLMFLYAPPDYRKTRSLQLWLTVIIAFVAVTAPMLINQESWQNLWQGASLGARLAAERAGRPEPDISDTVYVLRNIEYGFFSWLWSGVTSHWIYGPHLDVISSTFAALGLVILALGRLPGYVGGWLAGWRGRLWLVSTYLGALAATAGMNPYPQVSNNRMFALLPYYAIWAALGAEQLLIWFTSLIGKAAWRGPAVAGLLAAVCALGFYQMSVLAPTKQAKPIPTTLALRIIQEEPPQGKVCFFGRDQYNLEIPRSFYSAFQITTDQFFVTNDQPPPVNDSGCGVILLDVGINNVEGIAAEVEAQHPNAARSNVRDDSGALQAIRFNLTD